MPLNCACTCTHPWSPDPPHPLSPAHQDALVPAGDVDGRAAAPLSNWVCLPVPLHTLSQEHELGRKVARAQPCAMPARGVFTGVRRLWCSWWLWRSMRCEQHLRGLPPSQQCVPCWVAGSKSWGLVRAQQAGGASQ